MAISFDPPRFGYLISPDELKEINLCSSCGKEIDINDFFRCETTRKFFHKECNLTWDCTRCGLSPSNPEHAHNHIIGVAE